jgi:hypothetical protein
MYIYMLIYRTAEEDVLLLFEKHYHIYTRRLAKHETNLAALMGINALRGSKVLMQGNNNIYEFRNTS